MIALEALAPHARRTRGRSRGRSRAGEGFRSARSVGWCAAPRAPPPTRLLMHSQTRSSGLQEQSAPRAGGRPPNAHVASHHFFTPFSHHLARRLDEHTREPPPRLGRTARRTSRSRAVLARNARRLTAAAAPSPASTRRRRRNAVPVAARPHLLLDLDGALVARRRAARAVPRAPHRLPRSRAAGAGRRPRRLRAVPRRGALDVRPLRHVVPARQACQARQPHTLLGLVPRQPAPLARRRLRPHAA
jgi:hypothetical protein